MSLLILFYRSLIDSLLLLFPRSVVSDSLWTHGLQQARFLCLSPPPRVCSNSSALSLWSHSKIQICLSVHLSVQPSVCYLFMYPCSFLSTSLFLLSSDVSDHFLSFHLACHLQHLQSLSHHGKWRHGGKSGPWEEVFPTAEPEHCWWLLY